MKRFPCIRLAGFILAALLCSQAWAQGGSVAGLLQKLNVRTDRFSARLSYRVQSDARPGQDTLDLHVWRDHERYRLSVPGVLDFVTDGRLALSLDHKGAIALLDTFRDGLGESLDPLAWADRLDSTLAKSGCAEEERKLDSGGSWFQVSCPKSGYRARLEVSPPPARLERAVIEWRDVETGELIRLDEIKYLAYDSNPAFDAGTFSLGAFIVAGKGGRRLVPPYEDYLLEDLTALARKP